jgi:hypothetical protein
MAEANGPTGSVLWVYAVQWASAAKQYGLGPTVRMQLVLREHVGWHGVGSAGYNGTGLQTGLACHLAWPMSWKQAIAGACI